MVLAAALEFVLILSLSKDEGVAQWLTLPVWGL